MNTKIAKKNRRKGKDFELIVRKDLEARGWIVDRWTNQVELTASIKVNEEFIDHVTTHAGKIVPAKPKFNPFTKSLMMNRAGFPDFIAFRYVIKKIPVPARTLEMNGNEALINPAINMFQIRVPEIIGVECKSGDKYHNKLSKEESAKVDWYVSNGTFSKFFIAIRGENPRGKEVQYIEHGFHENTETL